MKKDFNIFQVLLILIIGCGVTLFLTNYYHSDNPINIIDADTVYVKADTVFKSNNIFMKLPAKIDSSIVIDDQGDTSIVVVASADTLIQKDSSTISIKYFYPPIAAFEVDLNVKEKIVTITKEILKYIKIENPWWDKFWIGASSVLMFLLTAGLIFGGK